MCIKYLKYWNLLKYLYIINSTIKLCSWLGIPRQLGLGFYQEKYFGFRGFLMSKTNFSLWRSMSKCPNIHVLTISINKVLLHFSIHHKQAKYFRFKVTICIQIWITREIQRYVNNTLFFVFFHNFFFMFLWKKG